MNLILAFLMPSIFFFSILFAAIKKVRVYDSFSQGAKGAIPLVTSLFPYIATVMMLSQVFQQSGVQAVVISWLSPVFAFLGVPVEIVPLLFVKPLSGSGSIAVLSEILEKYGADSYISRCACVIYGASETIFYVGAVYFAGLKRKKLNTALVIAVLSFLASAVFACFLCRFL